MQNLKPLASLYSWAGWFESYLVANPEDRLFLDEAQLFSTTRIILPELTTKFYSKDHTSES